MPRTLSVTFTGADKVYDGGTSATMSAVDSRIAGDSHGINRDAAFADKNVGLGKPMSISRTARGGRSAMRSSRRPSEAWSR